MGEHPCDGKGPARANVHFSHAIIGPISEGGCKQQSGQQQYRKQRRDVDVPKLLRFHDLNGSERRRRCRTRLARAKSVHKDACERSCAAPELARSTVPTVLHEVNDDDQQCDLQQG
jgi:hypothetical protein